MRIDVMAASLQLFALAVHEVRRLLTPSQADVVALAPRVAADEGDGTQLV